MTLRSQSINDAIAEAKTAGYLGENILGSGFDLDIEVTAAPHNYVAGEDTAVIEVIEGKKAWPRQKPPFPVTVGLFGKPTSVNNVETLANVAPIILHGADWYRKFGTDREFRDDDFFVERRCQSPGRLRAAVRHAAALLDRRMRRRHEKRQKNKSDHAGRAVVGVSASRTRSTRRWIPTRCATPARRSDAASFA